MTEPEGNSRIIYILFQHEWIVKGLLTDVPLSLADGQRVRWTFVIWYLLLFLVLFFLLIFLLLTPGNIIQEEAALPL